MAYLKGYVGCGRTPPSNVNTLFPMLSALFYPLFCFKITMFEKYFNISQSFFLISYKNNLEICSILLRVTLQSVNLILLDFAYFFTFSFFKKHLLMAVSVILMACLLTKHSTVSTFKKTGVSLQSKFR